MRLFRSITYQLPGVIMLCLLLMGTSYEVKATPPPMVNGQPMASLAPMLAHVTPAVVNISSKTHVKVRHPFFNDPVFSHFFGDNIPHERIKQSLGSGVILNAGKGYIVTNNHVIKDADSIKVILHDGRTFKAQVVGTDPDTDIALLKINAKHLTALSIADSSKVEVGDFVAAVGNPFGLGQSVTFGIISALGRSGIGDTYQNFMQTDASINPGNSGGALVNLKGQLVGINSMIYSPSGANAGVGFAIPSNLVKSIVKQLRTFGKVQRGHLGINLQKLTDKVANALDIKPRSGVLVASVEPDSPAAKAGIRPGDVLTSINGKKLGSPEDLYNAEGLLTVGSKVTLTVMRNHHTKTVSMQMVAEKLAHIQGARIDPRLAGARLKDMSPSQVRKYQTKGVLITKVEPESRIARNGLKAGDIIIAINRRRCNNLKALKKMLAGKSPQQLMVIIKRHQQIRYALMH